VAVWQGGVQVQRKREKVQAGETGELIIIFFGLRK
jgi:hypothetical protein